MRVSGVRNNNRARAITINQEEEFRSRLNCHIPRIKKDRNGEIGVHPTGKEAMA